MFLGARDGRAEMDQIQDLETLAHKIETVLHTLAYPGGGVI